MIEEEQSKKLIETDINLPEVPSHVPEKPAASSKWLFDFEFLFLGTKQTSKFFLSASTESKEEEELEELKQWAS